MAIQRLIAAGIKLNLKPYLTSYAVWAATNNQHRHVNHFALRKCYQAWI